MASNFGLLLQGLANSGQNSQLQRKIGELVKSGQINKEQANKFFSDLVPIASKNQKPPKPLSSSELSNLKNKIAINDGSVSPALLSRAVQNNQISKEQANEFAKSASKNRAPSDSSREPSTAKKSLPSKQSGSSAPSSQSGSNLNREGFTELLERIKESKAQLSSKSGKSKTPAPGVTATAPTPADAPSPRVTGPAFKSVNTPVTNPDAPTNNVTKPTGAAAGPKPQNKKQSKLISDIANIDNLNLTNEQKNDLKFNRVQADNNNTFNRGDFKFLLNKLEGSKIRQNRDAQSQERKNIYSRGLSSMFANF